LTRIALTFLEQLRTGRPDQAERLVAPESLETLSAAELTKAWKALEDRQGRLLALEGAVVGRVERHDIVTVGARFEKGALGLRVVLTPSGQVAGLLFGEAGSGDGLSTMPAYADASAFEEMDYSVFEDDRRRPGLLVLPHGPPPFPAVMLIPGYGQHDRDGTIGPNKPLRDLAWGLGALGIASLRYDKPRLTASIGPDLRDVTYKEEFVDDALAAIRQLRRDRRIQRDGIFVLGHGLGGQVAPAIAARARTLPGTSLSPTGLFTGSSYLAGMVLLAGSARPLVETMIDQLNHIAMEDDQFKLEEARSILAFQSEVEALLETGGRDSPPVMGLTYSYLTALNNYDCLKTAQRAKIPMLILQGQRDFQVTAARDFEAWREALKDRADVAFKLYPDLNHLFMTGAGASYPSEYERAGHVAEEVVHDIAQWIKRAIR